MAAASSPAASRPIAAPANASPCTPGGQVISVDYVQLPEGNVADSVQDAISAYEALLEMVEHPDKIVVAGDSAGGYLTMKIAELATRRGLTPPAALLTFSPVLSLDFDREDKDIARVSRMRDAYLPKRRIALVRERWVPEGSSIEGYASPLLATSYINSPAFFVAAEDEILRPEVEAMALQLSERGVDVETHLWRGQVHAFPVMVDFVPESRQALKLAADFARLAVGELEREAEFDVVADPDAHEETIVGEMVSDDESRTTARTSSTSSWRATPARSAGSSRPAEPGHLRRTSRKRKTMSGLSMLCRWVRRGFVKHGPSSSGMNRPLNVTTCPVSSSVTRSRSAPCGISVSAPEKAPLRVVTWVFGSMLMPRIPWPSPSESIS